MFKLENVKEVEILTENMEMYTIPVEGIEYLNVYDLHFSFGLHCNGLEFGENPGETWKAISADNIFLILNNKGRNTKGGFQQEPFDKRKYHDITQLIFKQKNGEEITVLVPWSDDGDEENSWQHNESRDAYTYINIGKDFNEQEFKEHNDFYEVL